MKNQRGRNRAAERRAPTVPWIVVAGALDVALAPFRSNFVLDSAEVPADINLILVKDARRFHRARASSRSGLFDLFLQPFVKLRALDHRAAMRAGPDLIHLVGLAHAELDAPPVDLGHLGIGSHLVTFGCGS